MKSGRLMPIYIAVCVYAFLLRRSRSGTFHCDSRKDYCIPSFFFDLSKCIVCHYIEVMSPYEHQQRVVLAYYTLSRPALNGVGCSLGVVM
jgi:hypothetical protein